jgi:iron(II)-dependent oxidoreductase
MQNAREWTEQLASMLVDTRKRTLELVSHLNDEQMMGPQLRIANPPLWEIGHLAWFQEYWCLRRPRGTWYEADGPFDPSILENSDALYNSMEVAHDTRWDLPLLSREDTLAYMQHVLDDTLHKLNTEGPTEENAYFARLATFHEDMHGEAFTYTRYTHAFPAPHVSDYDPSLLGEQPTGPHEGDAEIAGGEFMLGAAGELLFVFDNEKWAHPVEVAPFAMARAPRDERRVRPFR